MLFVSIARFYQIKSCDCECKLSVYNYVTFIFHHDRNFILFCVDNDGSENILNYIRLFVQMLWLMALVNRHDEAFFHLSDSSLPDRKQLSRQHVL